MSKPNISKWRPDWSKSHRETGEAQNQDKDDVLDEALNWNSHVLIESMLRSDKTGEKPNVHVTQEIIDKHKAKALAQIKAHYISKQEVLEALEDDYEKIKPTRIVTGKRVH